MALTENTFAPVIRYLVMVWLCCLGAFPGWSQAVPDTLINRPLSDSLRDQKRADAQAAGSLSPAPDTAAPFQPIPKKAALYSAMLPGAGQYYNRQYWKIPVIYAGVGVSLGFLIYNTKEYRTYRSAYLASFDPLGSDNELTKLYTTAQLKTRQDSYRQDLDMTVLFTTLGFALQVADALVYAHLRNFDVSKDLSLRLRPVQTPAGPAMGLVLNF